MLWLLFCVVWAFDELDHQIFDVVDSLAVVSDLNFYSILDVDQTASTAQIQKAYRKKALALHPDKNDTAEAAQLYKVLTQISVVLKDDNMRNRYDAHLKKGFPSWRGSGYYYSKYKPGFLIALLFTLFFISVAQYILAWISYHDRYKAYKDSIERMDQLSYTQVKKILKRKNVSLSKQEFKEQGSSLVNELTLPSKPKVSDVVLLSLPRWALNKIRAWF
jgi:curved DNA-binding protein CbpA